MDLCDIRTIKALLGRHGFRFSKSMGQNFLIEDWVPRDIADASGASPDSGVLEIGPGIGPLTAQLCARAGKVAAVELDRSLLPVLAETMAEFDNFRKRTEKEKASMYEIGAREVIEKILPIVDNFERGLAAVPEEEKETPFVDGMNKIYRQLLSVFEGMGVKAIESVGQEFNPDYHNAVMHVEDEEAGENVVVEEFQKGYTYKDTVIRHSMVKVAN